MPAGIDAWLRELSAMDPTGGVAVALAVVLASFIPLGVLAAWLAASPALWRRIAYKPMGTLLAMFCVFAGQALTYAAARWAGNRLLDPSRWSSGNVLFATALALAFLSSLAVLWGYSRHAPVVTRSAAQLTGPPDLTPPTPSWKTRVLGVREEPGRTEIVLRPYSAWDTIAFPLGMIVGFFLAAFLSGKFETEQQRVIGALIGLGTGFGLGILGALVAYFLVGREQVLTVCGGMLSIDRELLRRPKLRRRRSYMVGGILNLRSVEPPPVKTSDRYVRPVPPPWLLYLAFDYEGRNVQFGVGLDRPDADQVLRVLARSMSAPTQ